MGEAGAVVAGHNEIPAPAAQAVPRFVLGRSALLVHGLALLFCGAAWGLMLWLGEHTQEGEAVQGVGGAAALILALWSGVLALRALAAGERPAWPITILTLGLLEASVPCVLAWWPLLISYEPNSPVLDLAVAFGLPVFVPFFALATFLAAPLAWGLTRRAEKKALKAGKPPWERRRRWKRGLAWYAAFVAALTILVLPFPLYLFCVGSFKERRYEKPKEEMNWRRGAVAWTPDFVKSTVDGLVARLTRPSNIYLRLKLVVHGKIPKERLLEYLRDSNREIVSTAWMSIEIDHPDEASAYVHDLASGNLDGNLTMQCLVGIYIAEKWDTAGVHQLFESHHAPYWCLNGFLRGLCFHLRKDFLPEVKAQLIKLGFEDYAWEALQYITNEKEFGDICEGLSKHSNPEYRKSIAKHIWAISNAHIRLTLLKRLLGDSDAKVSHSAMYACFNFLMINSQSNLDPDLRFRIVDCLAPCLEGSGLILRRGAVLILSKHLNLTSIWTTDPFKGLPGQPTTDQGGTPAPETPAELQELQTVRAAAQAWLEKHRGDVKRGE